MTSVINETAINPLIVQLPPTVDRVKKYRPEEAKEEFNNLASQWLQEVEGMSSTVEMAKHPAYQKIVNMGQSVIPFLLEDLHQNPIYWLSALRQITQENPVLPEHKGNIKKMAEAWLNWGKQKGYIVQVRSPLRRLG